MVDSVAADLVTATVGLLFFLFSLFERQRADFFFVVCVFHPVLRSRPNDYTGGDIELSEKQQQGLLEIDANNQEIDELLGKYNIFFIFLD